MPSWIDDWSDPAVILTLLVIFFGALLWVIKREVGRCSTRCNRTRASR